MINYFLFCFMWVKGNIYYLFLWVGYFKKLKCFYILLVFWEYVIYLEDLFWNIIFKGEWIKGINLLICLGSYCYMFIV